MTTNGSGECPSNNHGSAPRTDITVILDRSGSMGSRREEVVRSFNGLLAEQRAVPGKARLTLVQFDHEYEPVYEAVRLGDAPDLSEEIYQPRGTTALLDAVGRTIARTEKRLDRRAKKRISKGKDPSPPRVLVVVITDGLENASTDHTLTEVRAEISRLESDAGWSFVFLGAGLDAFSQAGSLGMDAKRSMRSGVGAPAMARSMDVMSRKMRAFRAIKTDATVDALRAALDFTAEERQEADDQAGD